MKGESAGEHGVGLSDSSWRMMLMAVALSNLEANSPRPVREAMESSCVHSVEELLFAKTATVSSSSFERRGSVSFAERKAPNASNS